jgi:hypothetical protein
MTPTAVRGTAASASTSRVAALVLDALTLLVPQQDVRTLESSIDVDTDAPTPGAVGWVVFRQERWPVYCLSATLEPMPAAPTTRRVCVVLSAGTRAFGLLCSEVALLESLDAPAQAMPEAMALPGSPIYALTMHEDSIACLSSAVRILAAVDPSFDGVRQ